MTTPIKAARTEYQAKGGRPWDEVKQEIKKYIASRDGKKKKRPGPS